MSIPRRALAAVFVISAAVVAPAGVAVPTLGEDQQPAATEWSPPACGNGKLQASKGEVCDDGNNENGDGCSADCRSTEICGNGKVDAAAGEQCDTSGETSACNADCTVAFCGDGRINFSRGESCDTAGPSASCNVFCQPPTCGNGVLEELEQCDDANSVDNDFCTNKCQFNCFAAR